MTLFLSMRAELRQLPALGADVVLTLGLVLILVRPTGTRHPQTLPRESEEAGGCCRAQPRRLWNAPCRPAYCAPRHCPAQCRLQNAAQLKGKPAYS